MEPTSRLRSPALALLLCLAATLTSCGGGSSGDDVRVEDDRSGGAGEDRRQQTDALLRQARPTEPVTSMTPADPDPRRLVARPWRLDRPATAGEVEGYVDRPGAPPRATIGLRVSTRDRSFRVQAFRVGAYPDGATGLRVWRSGVIAGERQAAPRFSHPDTRTVVAGWEDSVRIDTSGWEPGVYVFRITGSSGRQAAAPYVVTSPTVRGRVVLVVPVTTWQAYNSWGGYSLYTGPSGDRRAWRVSFDRPYDGHLGELGFTAAPVTVEAEATGVPLAWLTNLDLDADPRVLDGAVGYVSTGHDEYWTPRMRDTVERARAAGTNLAFLAANTLYWRIRLTGGRDGRPGDVVGYRSDAWLDPAPDPARQTSRWRDGTAADPENRLVGLLYECYPVDAPFQVVSPDWWGFRGTGVRRGTSYPHLVGNEADRVYPVPGTPRPLEVLGDVDYSCRGVPTSAQATYYVHRSGAGVVATGTLRWTCTLTGGCFGLRMEPRTVAFVRQVTRTIVTEFARGPVGDRFPARDNVDRFDLPTENSVDAS